MNRAGVTLVELLVVLVVLGLLGGMSALAVGAIRAPVEDARHAALRRARAEAIRSGTGVRVSNDGGAAAYFLPDGRGVGRGIDPLTGEIVNEAR